MSNPITTLTCPSCGGKLQISDKINRFACGYCGNEQIVHRESGIVYLEPIAEDVRHIRTSVEGMRGGVDRTAAELSVARLTRELNDLESELKSANTRKFNSWKPMSNLERVLIVLDVLILIIASSSHAHIAWWWIFYTFVFISISLWIKRCMDIGSKKSSVIEDLEKEITKTREDLTRNRRLI